MAPEIIDCDDFTVVGVRVVLEMGTSDTATLWREKFLPLGQAPTDPRHRYYAVFNFLTETNSQDLAKGIAGIRCEYVMGILGSLDNIPVGMVSWVIPSGKFAEATAKGIANIRDTVHRLIADWLPDSGYRMVPSPMFAYTENKNPEAEDAIWKVNIPVEKPEVLAQLENWLV